MATIRVKNPNLGGEKWITIPTKILSEADHIVTNKGLGNLYLSNDGTYKDVIKSANDYTDKLIELITGSSPDILETLKELSNQTSDNKDFINVLNKSIATKLDKTANAVSASKLATPIKLWGNDFDGSLSVYGNLCAPNGNLGLGINTNNVVLGNNTNPSYIYGSNVMFKTGTNAISIYVDFEGKVGIGTANPLRGFYVNTGSTINSSDKSPLKIEGGNEGEVSLGFFKDNAERAVFGYDKNIGAFIYDNTSNSRLYLKNGKVLFTATHSSSEETLLHSGNFSNYALPLTGGAITGSTTFNSPTGTPLVVKQPNGNSVTIAFKSTNTVDYSYIGFVKGSEWFVTDDGWNNAYKIYHEGNFNPDDYLSLTGGTITGNSLNIGSASNLNRAYAELVTVATDSEDAGVALRYHRTIDYLGRYSGILIDSKGVWYDATGGTLYEMYHKGNFNPDNYLSLSGGLINGHVTINHRLTTNYRTTLANNAALAFIGGDGTERLLMPHSSVNYALAFNDGTNTLWYKIWHEGNDGEGSGLDADTIHGINGKYLAIFDPTIVADDTAKHRHIGYGYKDRGWYENGPAISFGANQSYYALMLIGYDNSKLVIRTYNFDKYTDWKTIAFTDSDITGDSAGALILRGGQLEENLDLNALADYSGIKFWKKIPNNTLNAPISEDWANSMLQIPLHGSSSKYAQFYFSSGRPLYYRSEHTADWKELTTSDGYYKDLRVGLADDLGGIEEKVESEYTIQPTANTSEIRDGYALIESLKGNSVVWNQLFDGVVRSSGSSENVLQDGKYICTPIGTPAAPGSGSWSSGWSNLIRGAFPGKHLVNLTYTRSSKRTDIDDFVLSDASVRTTYVDTVYTFPIEIGETKQISCIINVLSGDDDASISVSLNDCIVKLSDISVINLTKMFGEGNEPETIEEFYARIPKGIDLYAYNEGEIINLTADSIKSVGFNQWDEEWEVGGISSNGNLSAHSDRVRSKNYIPCAPNTWYFAKGHFKHGIFFYDENKKWIENKQVYGQNFQFFTPSNVVYMLWNGAASYFTEGSYCINLFNEDANNTYEPYKEFVRQLPTNLFEGGMKSVDTIHDEIYWDKNKKKYVKVTRVGSVDWDIVYIEYREDYKRLLLSTQNKKLGNLNVISSRYIVNTAPVDLNQSIDKVICGYYDRYNIYIHDFDYSDAETYRAAMKEQGVEIYYELAEPIIEELDIPYMDYEVSNDGTERIESSTPTTPIKASVTYNFDAINTIKQNIFDISDIKKGATKLAKPVKLWGQSFDGSSDISEYTTPVMERINFSTVTGANEYDGWVGRIGDAADILLCTVGWNYLFLKTNALPRLTIAPNGNVGIGTTNPQYKLDVEGNFRSVLSTIGSKLEKGYQTRLYFDTKGFIIQPEHNAISYNVNTLLNPNGGNIGIGTTDPQGKLDVSGSVYAKVLNINRNIKDLVWAAVFKNSYNVEYEKPGIGIKFALGHDNEHAKWWGIAAIATSDFSNTLDLIFHYGKNSKDVLRLNSNGNVTIGESDLAGSNYKFYVDGKSYFKGNTYTQNDILLGYDKEGIYLKDNSIMVHDPNNKWTASSVYFDQRGNVSILHKLTIYEDLDVKNVITGDLVDWYGVSWSENSSDPTCTRIGNMALHRSLPILSAMKGYWISNKHASNGTPETIIPVNDSFTELKYVGNTNDTYPITHLTNGGIFIKIPEFWYIDDYELSTKTHNLKISQTAKAGWCHHKEAYVSAYEGYVNGSLYKAIKNVIPTVSQTREQLRTAARANGFEGESKWNIYTYEEHRAICHLFLVEYATRNSQLAVNTTLTADGFKQGGLGSGCTTGTVTINGQTTYSFIPTGTTDSLGNGSGQVAYTVTQTDADGNELGTVTRYANRYRGIENPFGHIWKHVDDIVNVYNAETTYKIVYKCNKPEHFATNKNAKYKPLCSFPGGSKMQGWSKEIKATINCDFFKYSVGGSESTYWCDYNYDNDDTSEHCLLIGGGSGDGGQAGLFRFALHNGVGHSTVSIGSRLTYLPWAE